MVLANLARAGKADLHLQRLHDLTQGEDAHVAVKALALTMAYRYGKPPEHVTIAGDVDRPLTMKVTFELHRLQAPALDVGTSG